MKPRILIALLSLILVSGAIFYLYISKNIESPQTAGTIEGVKYENKEYGFSVKLPDKWKGFSVETKEWVGEKYQDGKPEGRDKGPLVSISAPATLGIEQDMPVMVFTLEQWNLITAVENNSSTFMSVSAAPIPPSELGRNSNYVFAIPPRYNYAFPRGWEEVEDIVKNKTLWNF